MMLVAGCYLFVHWGCSWTAFPLPIPAGVALQWSSLVSSCPLCMPFVVKAISVLNANTEANCLVRSSRKQEKSLKDWIPEEFSGLMVLVDLTGLGLTGNCHIARFQERRQSILGLTVLKQTKKYSETVIVYIVLCGFRTHALGWQQFNPLLLAIEQMHCWYFPFEENRSKTPSQV